MPPVRVKPTRPFLPLFLSKVWQVTLMAEVSFTPNAMRAIHRFRTAVCASEPQWPRNANPSGFGSLVLTSIASMASSLSHCARANSRRWAFLGRLRSEARSFGVSVFRIKYCVLKKSKRSSCSKKMYSFPVTINRERSDFSTRPMVPVLGGRVLCKFFKPISFECHSQRFHHFPGDGSQKCRSDYVGTIQHLPDIATVKLPARVRVITFRVTLPRDFEIESVGEGFRQMSQAFDAAFPA